MYDYYIYFCRHDSGFVVGGYDKVTGRNRKMYNGYTRLWTEHTNSFTRIFAKCPNFKSYHDPIAFTDLASAVLGIV